MTRLPRVSPVEAPVNQDRATSFTEWPPGAADLAVELQRRLSIGDRDWHALKGQRARRGAEQLAAALVLLLSSDSPQRREAGAGRLDAIALTEHALSWLKAEISDPGCPSHHQRGRADGEGPPVSGD